jgi:type I restriction enzyme S subunit
MSITMNYGLIDQGEKFKRRIASKDISNYKLVHKNEMVVGFPIDEGVIGFQQKYAAAAVSPAYDIWKLKSENIDINFLEMILRSDHARQLYREKMQGTAGRRRSITKNDFLATQIPLPPLEIQHQIVDEISAHQRIIDGARQVVEGWNPDVNLELIQTLPDGVDDWKKAKIDDVCDFIDYRGKTPNKSESGVRLITAKNVKMGALFDEPREYIADYDSWMTRGIPKKGDVLFTTEGPLGNVAVIDIDDEKFAVGQRIITLQSKDGIILPIYLANVLMSKSIQAEIEKLSTGSTVKGILARYFREIEIPLPPLEIQREIVARIERERAIVAGNRELIQLYEAKVKKVIEKVWQA